jgi:hypothetical protein
MYIFKKEQDASNKFDFTKIQFEIDAVQSDDIIREFFYFMVGCGFNSQNIVESFVQIASEYTILKDEEN